MKKSGYLIISTILVFLLFFGCLNNGSSSSRTQTSQQVKKKPTVIIKHVKKKNSEKKTNLTIKVNYAARPITVMRQTSKYVVCTFDFGSTKEMRNHGTLVVSQTAYTLLLNWSGGKVSRETCLLNGTTNEMCYVTSSISKPYFEKAFNASCDSIVLNKPIAPSTLASGRFVEAPTQLSPIRMAVLSQAGVRDAGSSLSLEEIIPYPASKNMKVVCKPIDKLTTTEQEMLSVSGYHPCSSSLEQKEMAVARCGPLLHVNKTAYERCLQQTNNLTQQPAR